MTTKVYGLESATRAISRNALCMTAKEWQWVSAWVVLVVALVGLPYLLAATFSPDGRQFIGSFWSPHDLSQYKAAMREAAASSSWLIHDHLTPEAHTPALIYPFYVVLGKLASVTHLETGAVYWAALVAGWAFLVFAVYIFCSAFLGDVWQRRAGFLLTVGASGLAAFIPLAGLVLGAQPRDATLYAEWNLPEVGTFLTLFTYPHLVVALGLIVLAGRSYVVWMQQGRRVDLAMLLLAVILVGFAHPFSLGTIGAALGIYLVAELIFLRRIGLRQVTGVMSVLVVCLPFLLYNMITFSQDPFWGAVYGKQNVLPSPSLVVLTSGLGFMIPLAGFGLVRIVRRPTQAQLFLLSWVLASVALMYLPVPYQKRFAFGLQPFLSVLATYGVAALLRGAQASAPQSRTARFLLRRGGRYAFITLLGFSSLVFYLTIMELSLGRGTTAAYSFERQSVVAATDWLRKKMTAEDVVFAEEKSGNYLAGEIPGRVFLAHWTATLDAKTKRQQAALFYNDLTQDAQRRQILELSGADFVFYGPYERELGPFVPAEAPYLSLVYESSDVSIYRVSLSETEGSPTKVPR